MAVPPERVTVDDADKVVNAPVLAVELPIAGGLVRSREPPSVRLPEVVTVPVKVKPLTVPVPPTEVTVPNGLAAHDVFVPSVVRYLPLLPVCDGARALKEALAVV